MAVAAPSGIARFPLDRGSGCEELAMIPQVFLGNAFGNGLGAFKLSRGIEVAAILAGMQIGLAFRASAFEVDLHGRRNDCSAQ